MRLTPAIPLPLAIGIASAAEPAAQPAATFDAALAKRLGADERGMRMYVLEGIYACYQRHHRHFLRTRRYPPPDPAAVVPLERRERLQLMVEKMRLDFP